MKELQWQYSSIHYYSALLSLSENSELLSLSDNLGLHSLSENLGLHSLPGNIYLCGVYLFAMHKSLIHINESSMFWCNGQIAVTVIHIF